MFFFCLQLNFFPDSDFLYDTGGLRKEKHYQFFPRAYKGNLIWRLILKGLLSSYICDTNNYWRAYKDKIIVFTSTVASWLLPGYSQLTVSGGVGGFRKIELEWRLIFVCLSVCRHESRGQYFSFWKKGFCLFFSGSKVWKPKPCDINDTHNSCRIVNWFLLSDCQSSEGKENNSKPFCFLK